MAKKAKVKVQNTNNLSAIALRDSLWEVLNRVKNGDMTPAQANAIAAQARAIVSVVRLQLEVTAQAGRTLPAGPVRFAEEV